MQGEECIPIRSNKLMLDSATDAIPYKVYIDDLIRGNWTHLKLQYFIYKSCKPTSNSSCAKPLLLEQEVWGSKPRPPPPKYKKIYKSCKNLKGQGLKMAI
ncbi:hypothetical protein TorRG33x02_043470, partial [Trema orientale]